MRSVLVTPPASEPITLAEAKAHLRVLHDAEDELIETYVSAARQYAEEYTKRAFITQTWQATLDAFPCGRIRLPRPPLIEVTEIAYTDGNGDPQTVTGFWSDEDPIDPAITPLYGQDWPIARDFPGVVRITYKAGYGAAADVPPAIKNAIRFLVGHYYVNREAVVVGTITATIPMAVNALLDPFRIRVAP